MLIQGTALLTDDKLSWLATSMPKPQVAENTQQWPTDGLPKRS